MDIIVKTILALLISAVPLSKPSPYSFEPVPECGTDPEAPACPLEPQCDVPGHFACAPPRWSGARNAWVVIETPEHKLQRYYELAVGMKKAAFWHTRCRAPDTGAVTEQCWPTAKWPEGPTTLLVAAATASIWESGLREDIQYGYPPVGRGPGGEGCIMQLMPEQVLPNATWLSPDRREALAAEMDAKELRAWGERAVLEGPDAQFRCFAAGMNMLSRARRACQRQGPWVTGMYSMYGTGRTCNATGIMDNFHVKRAKTYRKLRRQWAPRHTALPPGVLTQLGFAQGEEKAPDPRILVDPRACRVPKG